MLGLFSALQMMQGRLNADLPADSRLDSQERACLRQAREAEWRFRVSKGYEKDTPWNHFKFRMTHPD